MQSQIDVSDVEQSGRSDVKREGSDGGGSMQQQWRRREGINGRETTTSMMKWEGRQRGEKDNTIFRGGNDWEEDNTGKGGSEGKRMALLFRPVMEEDGTGSGSGEGKRTKQLFGGRRRQHR